MNTKNNNFQFSRLLMVMRWDVFTNLKSYLNMMLGMTFALLPFFIMQLYQLSKQYQLFPNTIDLSYWGDVTICFNDFQHSHVYDGHTDIHGDEDHWTARTVSDAASQQS